jgi:hypothetical protein
MLIIFFYKFNLSLRKFNSIQIHNYIFLLLEADLFSSTCLLPTALLVSHSSVTLEPVGGQEEIEVYIH